MWLCYKDRVVMSPTILVVDDHQLYRTTFCMLLQLCWPNAQIVEAMDASQALAVFPQHAWDCMIFDYQLPTLSGGDLARHLRARAQAHGQALPPLFLMSTQPDAATFARAIGAVAFLPKPIDVAELRSALTPVLGARAVTRGAVQPLPQRDLAPAPPIAPAALRARPTAIAPVSGQRMLTSTQISRLQDRIQHLVEQTMTRFPPPHAVVAPTSRLSTSRMGDYLVQRGYLTRWQLTCALQANQSPTPRGRVPLGFIVRAHNMVPSPVLSALLLQQFCDRLSTNPATPPRFVGEQLLLSADLTPAQLAVALQEQLDDYQDGRWVRVGDILARRGWSTPAAPSVVQPNLLRRD
jgi:CheY-like chemotaxis protein